jgi:aminoglycoside phosphotransferase (APT) family kinase protein
MEIGSDAMGFAAESGQLPGIDPQRVSDWLVGAIPGVTPPFSFGLISGGNSNLTVGAVDAAGRRLVLRRPPLRGRLSTAHDMRREYRILSGLIATEVPVPRPLAYCDDESVSKAGLYVMEHVDGVILHDREQAVELAPADGRRTAAESLIDVLAALHAVVPGQVGLGDLGREENYIARQLGRWWTQYLPSAAGDVRAVRQLHDALAARIPAQGPASIVHGDYKPGNMVHAPTGEVLAVLDWELCTLGEPLADVGFLMLTWGPAEPRDLPMESASWAEGFPSARKLLDRYTAISGRDTSKIHYYMAFSAWRFACIIEGVRTRYLAGALGGPPPDTRRFTDLASHYLYRAAAELDREGSAGTGMAGASPGRSASPR